MCLGKCNGADGVFHRPLGNMAVALTNKTKIRKTITVIVVGVGLREAQSCWYGEEQAGGEKRLRV